MMHKKQSNLEDYDPNLSDQDQEDKDNNRSEKTKVECDMEEYSISAKLKKLKE